MDGNSRLHIVGAIGEQYLTMNIENGEYSYRKGLQREIKGHCLLDLRFYDEVSKIAVLVETKQKISPRDEEQLFDYVTLEQELSTGVKIIAILASTMSHDIRVWKIQGTQKEVLSDTRLKTFEEYTKYFVERKKNNWSAILENTSQLNRLLHDNGLPEKIRSQFVGICLLALKNGLIYTNLPTGQIVAGIEDILDKILQGGDNMRNKFSVLSTSVLHHQKIKDLKADNFQQILLFIKDKIFPYIDESSMVGHDILSYFFTTFNKYVQREDKNQAFTPNHIAHFMCKIAEITRSTRILDPTCGSGTFLVQAMAQSLARCETDTERDSVKREHIFGIEKDDNVYGLATTNMLIHGDGNSNILSASCFNQRDWISRANIDLVLMNPPYNASKADVPSDFANTWGKTSTDPSKGLYFVEYIASCVNKGRLITLLPLSCAITTNGVIRTIKEKLLEHHTLDAVFSFPTEMFYPGASAVACCMVFELNKPHNDADKETFFGYFKKDGFAKRKGVGRIDVDNQWEQIEQEWLDLYTHRLPKAGLSITRKVTVADEWCAEAYMQTDYSTLCENDFVKTIQNYASYIIKNEK